MRGLEPPRCHHHRLLRPARLPVPPHPLINGVAIMRMRFRQCQEGPLAGLALSVSGSKCEPHERTSGRDLSFIKPREMFSLLIPSSTSHIKSITRDSTVTVSSIATNVLVWGVIPLPKTQPPTGTSIIPAPIASIMTVHKLATLVAPSPIPVAMTTALSRHIAHGQHGQERNRCQSQHRKSKHRCPP